MPTIAFTDGTSTRNRASRALRLRSPRDTPLPLPMNVLLLRWDTKPDKRIRGTFLRPASTRRTSFYAATRTYTFCTQPRSVGVAQLLVGRELPHMPRSVRFEVGVEPTEAPLHPREV